MFRTIGERRQILPGVDAGDDITSVGEKRRQRRGQANPAHVAATHEDRAADRNAGLGYVHRQRHLLATNGNVQFVRIASVGAGRMEQAEKYECDDADSTIHGST